MLCDADLTMAVMWCTHESSLSVVPKQSGGGHHVQRGAGLG